jgi:hypothetical protein
MLDDLLRGTWKFRLTLKREDGFLLSLILRIICCIDQDAVQQDESTVGSGKAEPQQKEVV